MAVDKSQVQLIISVMMVGLWGISVVVAQFDGNMMLKVITPFMTMTIGWLFTEKATA